MDDLEPGEVRQTDEEDQYPLRYKGWFTVLYECNLIHNSLPILQGSRS
ncbi:MAG: hypothetical protein PWP59_1323 [Sphaerochaeta sp.]|jgi:hypothetical protein|nr:hypothetical protein [Sphaerochaeta sp.]